MQNKYRDGRAFIKTNKRFIKEIESGSLRIERKKGNFKVLDEGDYQKFFDLVRISPKRNRANSRNYNATNKKFIPRLCPYLCIIQTEG